MAKSTRFAMYSSRKEGRNNNRRWIEFKKEIKKHLSKMISLLKKENKS